MTRALVALVASVGLVAATRASRAETPRQSFHAGIDARTDLGTHPVRVPVGLRRCAWDATLVLDPVFALDGEHDMDLIGEWFASERIALMFGWRWSAVQVADGAHHQQRSLVGVTAVGPELLSGRIRTSASFELATLWVKHGGGATADWISADRNFLDHVALGLFVRIEYGHAL